MNQRKPEPTDAVGPADGSAAGTERKTMPVRRIEAKRPALGWPMARLAGLHWYAVMVRAGTEFAVEALIERQGHVGIVPVRREWRRVNRYVRRKHEVKYPVLARYVFVGFDPLRFVGGAPPWRDVFGITMVQSVVGQDGVPRRMRGKLVAQFLFELGEIAAPRHQQYMATHHEFDTDDMVNIVVGPFRDNTVRVHSIVGAEAVVLLPLFGNAEQEVRVPLANLERAD